jgi:HAD superfamily hydrolase (TIGR01509 family)
VLRAIVFDFDGVIANSEPLHFVAFRDILAEEGLTLSERDYYASYLGYDDVQAFRAIAGHSGRSWGARAIGELVSRKARRLALLEQDRSILFPGAADAIRRAAAAMPVAIASGARRDEILRVLAREDLGRCFTAVVAAEDTPASKPAPDPYLRALSLLGPALGGDPDARECVAIEDSRWGLESARLAGLKTVGVTHTYPASELTSADLVIPSMVDLDLETLARLCQ